MTFPFPPFSPRFETGLTTVSLQASTTNAGSSITVPSGVRSGDLLLLLDRGGEDVTPSGFTEIRNDDITGSYQIASYKIADGSEASTSISGISTDNPVKILLVFRGDVAITGVTVNDTDGEATDGNPSSQTITSSGGTGPLISVGCYGQGSGG